MLEKTIGIRELVELLLRSGDLSSSTNSQTSALEGANIHREIQADWPAEIQAEASVKYPIEIAGEQITLQGRVDGWIENEEILEIKTSSPKFQDLPASKLQLYWGQIKVYAYILMTQNNLDELKCSLIYYQTTTEEITTKSEIFNYAEISSFFNELIQKYTDLILFTQTLQQNRNQSLQTLEFPFPQYRKNQRELAAAVYKTIALRKTLFTEAPTGTGKTISSLFPALKAMGESKINRIFYLTAKQSTRHVAEETLELLMQQHIQLHSITLTAKDQITFPEEVGLPDDKNPFFIGYYDRIEGAIFDILENETIITKETITTYARKHNVDPFEFSLDTSLFCDVIICDYNYLFDPLVYLQRFFNFRNLQNCLLIDEAHNLIARSKSMYTKEVSAAAVADLLNKVQTNNLPKALAKRLTQLLNAFDVLKTVLIENQQTQLILDERLKDLELRMQQFITYTSRWLKEVPDSSLKEAVLEVFLACHAFLKIADFFDDTFRISLQLSDQTNDLIVKVFSLNPSRLLQEDLALAGSKVLFSATFSPINYYQKMLGNNPQSLAYQLPSPFDPKNLKLIIPNYLPTTYSQRKNSLPQVVQTLSTMITSHLGNYLVFLPSYTYLEQLSTAFQESYPHVRILKQTPEMTMEERADFLAEFTPDPQEPLLVFAILGGIFSEGIDLKGSRLSGVAIITVGLPVQTAERQELQSYFNDQADPGFQYAYQLPGLNNVLQAAGRVIRTNEDVGVVLLIDTRFTTFNYRQFFPAHWQQLEIVFTPQQLQNSLATFWQKQTTKKRNK
ncbi:helicase C-terminal domain-containing protein [Ligilactobacillus ceti]|uniref:Superfamily ii dna and rna helicase n=1 Tax=Ligilactobacillus ceti DSM 22408 TaxID=1122146 RepID=A0A0R2KM61_9LACO|nr:helicase C-terminal domain-containing protein [Ligilactobacillus ceti]KRN90591.1 superfamily ii dna and rna helicase [Ligilactobacillus ceti DSM 22408]